MDSWIFGKEFDEFLDHVLAVFVCFLYVFDVSSALPKLELLEPGIQHHSASSGLGNHLLLGIFPDAWMEQLVNLTGM